MLTYNEQSWLAWKKRISRTKNVSAAWCHKCPQHGRNAAGCYGEPYCPLFPDLADALEFEGRVAAKLATIIPALTKDKPWPNILWTSVTPDMALKWARLRVEEEMDGKV